MMLIVLSFLRAFYTSISGFPGYLHSLLTSYMIGSTSHTPFGTNIYPQDEQPAVCSQRWDAIRSPRRSHAGGAFS